jgi:hypothetical protein
MPRAINTFSILTLIILYLRYKLIDTVVGRIIRNIHGDLDNGIPANISPSALNFSISSR